MLYVAADEVSGRAGNLTAGSSLAQGATTEHSTSPSSRFAVTKFRPTTLPTTVVTRSALHNRLTTGAGQRLGHGQPLRALASMPSAQLLAIREVGIIPGHER